MRRFRPGRLWWYYLPDLIEADRDTVTRDRRDTPTLVK